MIWCFIMKKIIIWLFAILLIIPSIFICACSNDGFEYVASVTFTTSGVTKTLRPYHSPKISAGVKIDKDEFDANHTYENSVPDSKVYISSKSELPPKDQMGVAYYYKKFDESKTVYGSRHIDFLNTYWYYNYEYYGDYYYYILVKIVNNTIIKIKDSKSETTYTVTSYSIQYLK